MATAFDQGIAWLREHRDEFSPRQGRDAYETVLLLKPFSELVLVLCLLRRITPGREFADMLEWAWSECESGTMLFRLLAARPDLIDVAGIAASFEEVGYASNRLKRLVGEVSRLTATRAVEAPNWRRIALRYSLTKLGTECGPSEDGDRSWLQSRPEPWMISDGSAYAVTHEVFYRTDFGAEPAALGEDVTRYLALWLPPWTRSFAEEENWDLVAELLLSARFVGVYGHAAFPHVEALRAAQREDGSFAGPAGAGRGLLHVDHAPVRRRFLSCYHTTLVAVLALAYCRS
jgi:hypothetical protein